jgi:hypothetical protein
MAVLPGALGPLCVVMRARWLTSLGLMDLFLRGVLSGGVGRDPDDGVLNM